MINVGIVEVLQQRQPLWKHRAKVLQADYHSLQILGGGKAHTCAKVMQEPDLEVLLHKYCILQC